MLYNLTKFSLINKLWIKKIYKYNGKNFKTQLFIKEKEKVARL